MRRFSQPEMRPRPNATMRNLDYECDVEWVVEDYGDDCLIVTAKHPKGHWARWISCDGRGWRFLAVSPLRWHDGMRVQTVSAMIGWLRLNDA